MYNIYMYLKNLRMMLMKRMWLDLMEMNLIMVEPSASQPMRGRPPVLPVAMCPQCCHLQQLLLVHKRCVVEVAAV